MFETTSLLLLLLVGFSSAMALQKRIIGGERCERPFHVRLRAASAGGSSGLCGGSLITNRWILTAAHCLKPGRTMFADVVMHRGRPAQQVEITAPAVIYTDKDNNNSSRWHDIMLLQLPIPADVQPVALPDCECRPETDHSTVHLAGHAATTGGPNNERRPGASSNLHCADIQVVDCENLSRTLQLRFPGVYSEKKHQRWFCGRSPGVDICYGDSGGGVVFNHRLYGVISFLGDTEYVCARAAAFMDLCDPQYAAWIKKTTA